MKRTSLVLAAFVCSTVFALTGCISEAPEDESDSADEESIATVEQPLPKEQDPTCYAIESCFASAGCCGWSHYTQLVMGTYYADNC